MKKPTVDYSGFRLSRINEPQFSHLWLLMGWVGYFTLYTLTELFIPADICYPVHCGLDDIIPFCEFFIVPYVAWYVLVFGTMFYFLFNNVDNFRKWQTYIIVTQAVAMIIYITFPTRQDLRPTEFPRDNLFTDVVRLLYTVDTNTGVCPSLHCAYSLGIASAWLREKGASRLWKAFIVVFCLTVCVSTTFVKQHSAVDFFVALPVCLLAEFIAYGIPKIKQRAAVAK